MKTESLENSIFVFQNLYKYVQKTVRNTLE